MGKNAWFNRKPLKKRLWGSRPAKNIKKKSKTLTCNALDFPSVGITGLEIVEFITMRNIPLYVSA